MAAALTTTHRGLTDNQRSFLRHYRKVLTISKAAAAAGFERGVHYDWSRNSQAYRDAFRDAQEEVTDRLEEEAIRRAYDGVERPTTVAGERELITEYDTTLLIFLLKANRPEKYRDRYDHKIEFSGDINSLSDTQREKMLMSVLTLACGGDAEQAQLLRAHLEQQARSQIEASLPVETTCEELPSNQLDSGNVTSCLPDVVENTDRTLKSPTAPSLSNLFPDSTPDDTGQQ